MNFKDLRLKKGLTLEQLSELTGISARTLEGIEKRGDCKLSTLSKLCKVLNIGPDELNLVVSISSYEELLKFVEEKKLTGLDRAMFFFGAAAAAIDRIPQTGVKKSTYHSVYSEARDIEHVRKMVVNVAAIGMELHAEGKVSEEWHREFEKFMQETVMNFSDNEKYSKDNHMFLFMTGHVMYQG